MGSSCMISVIEEVNNLGHFSRIAVMDRGSIVELGTYDKLIQKDNSLLKRMVRKSLDLNSPLPPSNIDSMMNRLKIPKLQE